MRTITHTFPYPPTMKDLFGDYDTLEWTAKERKGGIGMTYRLLPNARMVRLKPKPLTHHQFLLACRHVVLCMGKVAP